MYSIGCPIKINSRIRLVYVIPGIHTCKQGHRFLKGKKKKKKILKLELLKRNVLPRINTALMHVSRPCDYMYLLLLRPPVRWIVWWTSWTTSVHIHVYPSPTGYKLIFSVLRYWFIVYFVDFSRINGKVTSKFVVPVHILEFTKQMIPRIQNEWLLQNPWHNQPLIQEQIAGQILLQRAWCHP